MNDTEFLVWLKEHPELWDVVMDVLGREKVQEIE